MFIYISFVAYFITEKLLIELYIIKYEYNIIILDLYDEFVGERKI